MDNKNERVGDQLLTKREASGYGKYPAFPKIEIKSNRSPFAGLLEA